MPILLSEALKNLKQKKFTPEEEIAVHNALDELLSLDLTPPDEKTRFTAALEKYSTFWKNQGMDAIEPDAALDALKQYAAEQRVWLGLKDASEQTLIDLFNQNNEDDLRQYISTKLAAGKLASSPGWSLPATPKPGQGIVTDAALKEIQQAAAELLLIKFVEVTTDMALLKNLLAASSDSERIAAVKALGVNYDVPVIPVPAFEAAQKIYVEEAFATYLAGIPLASLSSLKAILETGDVAAHIKTAIDLDVELSAEQIDSAKGRLGAQYLQHELASLAGVSASDINGLNTDKDMVTFLKSKLGAHNYIDLAVNPQNMSSLKTSLVLSLLEQKTVADSPMLAKLTAAKKIEDFRQTLEGMGIKPAAWVNEAEMARIHTAAISKLEEIRNAELPLLQSNIKGLGRDKFSVLVKMAQLTDLSKFKEQMNADLGVDPTDWIDTQQMFAIQKSCLERALDLKLDYFSRFGGEHHAQLSEALGALPVKQQLELLQSNNNGMQHLLKARNAQEVTPYLGAGTTALIINKILDENQRVAGFKKIHNAALAKALIAIDPPIKLEHPTIQKINAELATLTAATFADSMKKIAAIITTKPDTDSENVDLVTAMTASQKQIMHLRGINKPLQDFYHAPARTPVGKAVLDVLASLAIPVKYHANENEFCAAFTQALHTQNTVDGFINFLATNPHIIPDGPNAAKQRKDLKDGLTKELSSNDYQELLFKARKWALSSANEESQTLVVSTMLSELETVKKEQKSLINASEKLAGLAAEELSGPAFDAYIKSKPAELQQEYMTLLQQHNVIIDQLQRNYNKLRDNLTALPRSPASQQIEEVRAKLRAEMIEINKHLTIYKKAQKNVISALREIDRVITGQTQYVFKGHGITHTTLSDAGLAKFKEDAKKAFPAKAGASLTASTATPSGVVEKMKLNGDRHYVYTVEDDATPEPTTRVPHPASVSTKGVFIQTFDHEGSAPRVAKDGSLIKYPTCKVEMVQPPSLSQGSDAAGVKELPPHAKVNFYMDMALAMITANGGKAPTRDNPIRLRGGTTEQMEALWTAFSVICKEKFNYDHAQIRAAVKVETGSFNPDNIMVKRRLREPVFGDNSQYKTVFQGTESAKKALEAKLDEADKILSGAKKSTEAITTSAKSMDGFKGKMQDMKAQSALANAKNTREVEGIVVPDPEPSRLKYN